MGEDPLIVVLTLTPVFVAISLVVPLIIRMRRLRSFWPFFQVLLAPGIVTHEISHYIMCRILRVKVLRVKLLTFTKHTVEGHVDYYPVENSFLKPFLIAAAPWFINTIFVCLLILVAPFFVGEWMSLLLGWLIVSIILSSGPSREDLANAVRPIVRYPRTTMRELGFVALGVVCGIVFYRVCLLTIGVNLPPLVVGIFSILVVAILCITVEKN